MEGKENIETTPQTSEGIELCYRFKETYKEDPHKFDCLELTPSELVLLEKFSDGQLEEEEIDYMMNEMEEKNRNENSVEFLACLKNKLISKQYEERHKMN